MNDRQPPKEVNFCNPADVAHVLSNEGAAMLAKVKLGEPIAGNDLAELLAYVALALGGSAQNSINRAQAKPKSNLVKPVFARS